MKSLQKQIEALLFCAPKPVSLEAIRQCLTELLESEVSTNQVAEHIEEIRNKFASDQFAFGLLEVAGGYQFMTKPEFEETVGVFLKQTSKKRLSKSALETLSIIAYRQPITRPELEQIRGVSCDYALKKLLDKELVEIRGKSEAVGRPVLYGTAPLFLEYFGINSLKELPTPKDFSEEEETLELPSEAEG